MKIFNLSILVALGVTGALLILLANKWFEMNSDINSKNLSNAEVFIAPLLELKESSKYDPLKINYLEEYNLIENLYSPLVEFSNSGDLVAGLASEFYWKGNKVHFKIRSGFKTIDGYDVTAEDAAFSLKRALTLSGNKHGNLKDILCPEIDVSLIETNCKSIRVENDELVLDAHKNQSFLIPMLGSHDFAIIPKRSVNETTLEIEDYRNTTGAYYISAETPEKEIILNSHPLHWHYSKSMPQKIKLVQSRLSDQNLEVGRLEAGEIDYIPKYTGAKREEIVRLPKEGFSVHKTQNIGVRTILFTKKGRQLSQDFRLALGREIREAYLDFFREEMDFYSETKQFFMPMGDGGLPESKIHQLDQKFEHAKSDLLKEKKVVLGVFKSMKAQVRAILAKRFPNITIEEFDDVFVYDSESYPIEKTPDLVIIVTDSTVNEDISHITYAINSGYFGMSKKDRAIWLAKYAQIPDKAERLKLLRKLHFDALSDPILVPLISLPYVSAVRKPWVLNQSRVVASDAFWNIRWNN